MKKLLTIFTPVYNREKTLRRLYASLLEQTSSNFEWLIVDDGSTDSSEDLIQEFINEKKITIRYFKQENRGKHVAHNLGAKECNTELFFCVDSDDFLTVDAVAVIEHEWRKIFDKTNIAGIVAYRGESDNVIIGTEFPTTCAFSSLQELYDKGKIGDTALIFRKEVLLEFPFPEFEGEKFLRESIVYDEIDEKYSLLVLRKIIYVCEYLPDGLTWNTRKHEAASPKGAALYRYHEYLKCKDFISKIAYASAYLYFSKKALQFKIAVKNLGVMRSILIMPCFFVMGLRNEYLLYKSLRR